MLIGKKPASLPSCTFGGVQTFKPATLHAWGVQTWKPARFKPGNLHVSGVQRVQNLETCHRFPKTLTFPGLDPQNVDVSRFGPPETYRFGPAGFQVWTSQNVQAPKRAGFQVWTPQNVHVSRFGPPKTCRGHAN